MHVFSEMPLWVFLQYFVWDFWLMKIIPFRERTEYLPWYFTIFTTFSDYGTNFLFTLLISHTTSSWYIRINVCLMPNWHYWLKALYGLWGREKRQKIHCYSTAHMLYGFSYMIWITETPHCKESNTLFYDKTC